MFRDRLCWPLYNIENCTHLIRSDYEVRFRERKLTQVKGHLRLATTLKYYEHKLNPTMKWVLFHVGIRSQGCAMRKPQTYDTSFSNDVESFATYFLRREIRKTVYDHLTIHCSHWKKMWHNEHYKLYGNNWKWIRWRDGNRQCQFYVLLTPIFIILCDCIHNVWIALILINIGRKCHEVGQTRSVEYF